MRFTLPVSTNQLNRLRPTIKRGEKRGQNAQRQRNRETFDRAARFQNKNRGRDEGGDISVEDGGEGFVVGGLERDFERFAERQFFPQSFVNQHARVDRQTNREDDARDTRQREHEVEHRERADQQDDIDDSARFAISPANL